MGAEVRTTQAQLQEPDRIEYRDLGTGSTAVNYSFQATGLLPGNTYWFCAITSNA